MMTVLKLILLEDFANVLLKKMDLPNGILIAAIHRQGTLIIPDGDTVIRANDRVIIFCLLSELTDLEKLITTPQTTGFLR